VSESDRDQRRGGRERFELVSNDGEVPRRMIGWNRVLALDRGACDGYFATRRTQERVSC